MFKSIYHLLILLLVLPLVELNAQEGEEAEKPRPIRNTFESALLIDNQTVDVSFVKTLEWDIQHRFGTWENGYEDYYGLAAPSNIRLGFTYVPLDKLQIGVGITKERKMWDFSAKYVLVKQKRDNSFPITIAYLGVAGLDSRSLDDFTETSDRFSYFNQVMFARRFSDRLSLQIAPSFSYFNFPERIYGTDGGLLGFMNNKHFAISGMARIGLSESIGMIVNADIPITGHVFSKNEIEYGSNPENNIAIGLEFTTSAHAFQVFIGNYQSINPQLNHLLNQNNFDANNILIGFNITRLWNF